MRLTKREELSELLQIIEYANDKVSIDILDRQLNDLDPYWDDLDLKELTGKWEERITKEICKIIDKMED